jgi:carbon-monoxide dehydrogenase large subunit
VSAGYKPKVDTGAFTYASHAAVVAIDTETGAVEILDYVVVEDCGVIVNPMIVEGQTIGGIAQGIGTALYEEMPYDEQGQPLASTLADYMLPGATEVPHIRIEHTETPSPHTEFGAKGMGEGGAIAPPAAIFNAVNDALRHTGAPELLMTPLTPRRLLQALSLASGSAGGAS